MRNALRMSIGGCLMLLATFVVRTSVAAQTQPCGEACRPQPSALPITPTFDASMSTSAAVTVSSGFFLAPMIAFSDG